MKDNIKIENTLSVTGLRRQKLNWAYNDYKKNEEKLINLLINIITPYIVEKGINNFLTGMASGADLIFAKTILKIKEEYTDITLQCILPYKNHDAYISELDIIDYKNIIKKADIVRILQNNYSKNCFSKRNQYLVNNSSVLLAITDNINKYRSGTSQTINLGIKNNNELVIINNLTFKVTNLKIEN